MNTSKEDNAKIRVAVDAMGGNFAPENEILGAILASNERSSDIEITLVGKENLIHEVLNNQTYDKNNIKVVDAKEVIDMHDTPSDTYKTKPNSSLSVALDLQKVNKSDALISSGNTGAVLANSILKLGRIKGIGRPTIGSIFPTKSGKTMVFDVGASVDCKAIHLYEYALMGSVYMDHVFNIAKPKVGLLNVGEEKSKGNELILETYKLLENSNMNFIGNVEGGDVLKGKADVIVCDGFVGNIILKFTESVLEVLKSKFRQYADLSFFKKVWIGMLSKTINTIVKDFDYQEHGGVPLLGINGVSIIGHGKSSPLAIKNMIFRAEEVVRKKVNDRIKTFLK
jgi:glycerol-3-phosphate acyltransferase PlsX